MEVTRHQTGLRTFGISPFTRSPYFCFYGLTRAIITMKTCTSILFVISCSLV